jgi:ParB-like chromosome segregation protein Spo0J
MNELIQVEAWQLAERQNYRQTYNQALVEGIASDMAEHGFDIARPIETYAEGDRYIIIDGHTRFKAVLLGSAYTIADHKPVMKVWIAVKDKPNDAQFKLMQLAGNELRENPDDMSKAIGYKQALDYGATYDQLYRATGHRQPYIDKRIALLSLTSEAQIMVSKGQLSIDYAFELTRLKAEYQSAAISAYTRASRCDLATFREIIEDLYQKQVKAETEQLPLFGGDLVQFVENAVAELRSEAAKVTGRT